MSRRYVARFKHSDPKRPAAYAKVGGGLTPYLIEAEVLGSHHKTREAWERLGYELIPVMIRIDE